MHLPRYHGYEVVQYFKLTTTDKKTSPQSGVLLLEMYLLQCMI